MKSSWTGIGGGYLLGKLTRWESFSEQEVMTMLKVTAAQAGDTEHIYIQVLPRGAA